MKSSGVTCIIPLYNESLNVTHVLSRIVKLPFITQLICVDDGSTDDSALKISTHFPQVELVRLPQNMGKSYAVKSGLAYAKYDTIMLIDADMQNIVVSEIKTAFKLYDSHQADMLILGWKSDNAFFRAMRGDIIISGGRFLKKRDLEKVFEIFKFQRYALEVAINRYMIGHKKTTCWFQTSAHNTFQTEKYGFIRGWKSAFEEGYSVMSSSQFGIVDQFFNFRPKKLMAEIAEIEDEVIN